jgi:hypothetical protein
LLIARVALGVSILVYSFGLLSYNLGYSELMYLITMLAIPCMVLSAIFCLTAQVVLLFRKRQTTHG